MVKPIVSVIMPMYNSKDIGRNIDEALKRLSGVGNCELIIVDDGSTNGCRKEAESVKNSRLRVVGYEKNQGKGNAIRYGFGFSSGKYVAFVDSGGDIDPKQVENFMKIMENEGADIVVGSKRHQSSDVHYPLARRFMSRTYQIINKILFNLDVKDTQVGIKLFKHEVLKKIMPRIAVKKFAFDLELLVIANKMGMKIVEAPVSIKYRFNSTISVSAIFWILWDTAAIFYRDKIINYYV